MERKKSAPKPVRYYAPNDNARRRLESAGIPRAKIYEAKEGETWDKIRLKRGEALGVMDGLRWFGGAVAIRKALEWFHGQDGTVVDIETGCDSRTHGVTMRDAAMQPIRLTPEQIKARQRADAIRRQIENGGMPERVALVHWRNADLSTDEALNKIGWTKSMAFKLLGARGMPAGRRRLQAAE